MIIDDVRQTLLNIKTNNFWSMTFFVISMTLLLEQNSDDEIKILA